MKLDKLNRAVLFTVLSLVGCGAPQEDKSANRPVKKKTISNNSDSNDQSSEAFGSDTSSGSSCRNMQARFAASTTSTGSAMGINFSLDVDANVNIQSNEKQGLVGINGAVKSARPMLAKGLADKAIGAYRDPLQLTFATLDEQKKLPGYAGLDCVVAAVKSIKNNAMEFTYDPPIPFIALTGASRSGAVTKTFPNIKARIVRHFESVARPGVYNGSATLTSSGDSVKIQFNFGRSAPSSYATPVAAIEYGYTGQEISQLNATIFVYDNSTTELALKKK